MDIAKLVQEGRVYLRKHFETIQVFDASTNVLVLVYERLDDGRFMPYDKIVDEETGATKWVSPTTGKLPELVEGSRTPYSEEIIHRIAERVINGENITAICKDADMPNYAQLSRWMRIHHWIKPTLEDARQLRAEHYRDKVAANAEAAESYKDPIEATKVKIDAHKWLAAQDDSRYKPNNKMDIGISVPTQIIIQTGVDRSMPQMEERPAQPPQEPQLEPAPEATLKETVQRTEGIPHE